MSIADKLTTINDNVPKVYAAGQSAEKAVCHARHYTTVIPGTGENTLTFHVPFDPDFVYIVGSDPPVITSVYNTLMAIFDRRSMGIIGGIILTLRALPNSVVNNIVTSMSVPKMCSREEDGTITIKDITTHTSGVYGVFSDQVQYTVTAVKSLDKTDKERITEMVENLTGSGSLTMYRPRVNAAFTDEEWAALIATKPDWTFAFVG